MDCSNIKLDIKISDTLIRDPELKTKIDQLPLELKQLHLTEDLVFLEVENGRAIIIDTTSIQFVMNSPSELSSVFPVLERLFEQSELLNPYSCVLFFEVKELKKSDNFNYLFKHSDNEFDLEFLGLKARSDTNNFNVSLLLNKNDLKYGVRTPFKCNELQSIEKDVLQILKTFGENVYPKIGRFVAEGIDHGN